MSSMIRWNPRTAEGLMGIITQAWRSGEITRHVYSAIKNAMENRGLVESDGTITDEGLQWVQDQARSLRNYISNSLSNTPSEAQVDPDGRITNLRSRNVNPRTDQPMTDIVPNDGTDGPLENARNNNNPVTRGTGETPITWFPKAEIGLRDTHTACLRYQNQYEFSITQGTAGQHASPAVYQFRMTSLYDIDATTASVQTPAWREYFATLYEFYSVIGCKWNIRVINSGATTDDTINLWWGYYGKKRPNPADRTQLYHMKGIKGPLIVPPRIAGMGDRSCSGRYKRGDHKREVQEDSETQLWSAMGANPTLIENLVLFFTSDVREAADTDNDITFEIIIDYIVQFKDLKSEYQFRSFTSAGVGSDISTDSPANTA